LPKLQIYRQGWGRKPVSEALAINGSLVGRSQQNVGFFPERWAAFLIWSKSFGKSVKNKTF
jgi:hypothetical protein